MKLIRFYKPELYPNEFAKVREVYELLTIFASKTEVEEETLPAPTPELPMPQQESTDSVRRHDDGTEPPVEEDKDTEIEYKFRPVKIQRRGFGSKPKIDEAEEFWSKALNGGNTAESYHGLKEECRRATNVVKNYQRLFWLLRVYPSLDEDKHPTDWLVQGYANTKSAELHDQYVEYLHQCPAEVGSDRFKRFEQLLDDVNHRYGVQKLEWEQQLKNRQWLDVRNDLFRCRELFLLTPALWLDLLVTVLSYSSWENQNLSAIDLTKTCWQLIKDLKDLELSHSHVFDRLEYLKVLAKAANQVVNKADYDEMLAVIQYDWTNRLAQSRRILDRVVKRLATTPNRWLNVFDQLNNTVVNPLTSYLHQLIDHYAREEQVSMFPQEPITFTQALICGQGYQDTRERLYQFCIQTYALPEQLIPLLSSTYDQTFPNQPSLDESITSDWPLRLVCLANRFYHS